VRGDHDGIVHLLAAVVVTCGIEKLLLGNPLGGALAVLALSTGKSLVRKTCRADRIVHALLDAIGSETNAGEERGVDVRSGSITENPSRHRVVARAGSVRGVA